MKITQLPGSREVGRVTGGGSLLAVSMHLKTLLIQ